MARKDIFNRHLNPQDINTSLNAIRQIGELEEKDIISTQVANELIVSIGVGLKQDLEHDRGTQPKIWYTPHGARGIPTRRLSS